ncbi:MAG: hypothetical protein RL150_378 [Candidatus Parcubacteria bacterium]|jgi:hypothetical protein
MNEQDVRAALKAFLGDKILTFTVEDHPNGEWSAICNEIPAIITGGDAQDRNEKEALMRDAIFTAAGIPKAFCNDALLRDASLQVAAYAVS